MTKKNTIRDCILQFLATSETGEGYSVAEISKACKKDHAYTRNILNSLCFERVVKKQAKDSNTKKVNKYHLFTAEVEFLGKSKVIDPSIVSW